MIADRTTAPEAKPDILQEAHDIINGERQDQYGKPENSFQIIAEFWNVLLYEKLKVALRGVDIDIEDRCRHLLNAKDIAIMMSLLKHARILGTGESRDNAKDAIGYLAIFEDRL